MLTSWILQQIRASKHAIEFEYTEIPVKLSAPSGSAEFLEEKVSRELPRIARDSWESPTERIALTFPQGRFVPVIHTYVGCSTHSIDAILIRQITSI